MEQDDLMILEEKITSLLNYCFELKEESMKLKATISEKDDLISDLETKIQGLNQERLEVRGRIESLVNRIDDLKLDEN